MQAVILAAGKGTRCHPLTLTRPKALLKIAGRTILEHNLEQLKGLADDVIIVVGYLGAMIRKHIGDSFGGMKVRYVEQKEIDGTGGALLLCEKMLKGRFLVLNGDDLYSRKDIERCLKHQYCVLGKEVDDPEKWGIFDVKSGFVTGLTEKPKSAKSNLANTGLYVLDIKIFEYKLKKSAREEYEATDLVAALARKEKIHYEHVTDYWFPIGYPWHILEANECLIGRIKKSVIKGTIEKGVTVKGKIVVGKGTVIKSGTYIEGPVMIGEDCTIGPNAYLRGFVTIGDGCKVGNAVEIKNSAIFDGSAVPHLSYIGDSVIGEHVNLGAGTITANLRFDHKEIKTIINGEKVNTQRRKLGAVVGDGAQTGIHVSLMPGVKIWPGRCVKPATTVYEDVVLEEHQ
jgi:bifunctional UDP-N-acetylglucosamine pyrophosphorylase/glucosamine-1-phosphate N-acetyltransferase